MKDKIMKMLMDKKRAGKEISGEEKSAKMKVVKDLKAMAEQMMGDNIKGMKKVTVAAPTPEGLKEGLETAEDLVENTSDMESSEEIDEMPSEEMSEEMASEDMYAEESEEMSEEELDAKLAELMAKKEKYKKV